jgi:hypothetical protein
LIFHGKSHGMWEVCGTYQYTSSTASRGAHELQEWLFFLTWHFFLIPMEDWFLLWSWKVMITSSWKYRK